MGKREGGREGDEGATEKGKEKDETSRREREGRGGKRERRKSMCVWREIDG